MRHSTVVFMRSHLICPASGDLCDLRLGCSAIRRDTRFHVVFYFNFPSNRLVFYINRFAVMVGRVEPRIRRWDNFRSTRRQPRFSSHGPRGHRLAKKCQRRTHNSLITISTSVRTHPSQSQGLHCFCFFLPILLLTPLC